MVRRSFLGSDLHLSAKAFQLYYRLFFHLGKLKGYCQRSHMRVSPPLRISVPRFRKALNGCGLRRISKLYQGQIQILVFNHQVIKTPTSVTAGTNSTSHEFAILQRLKPLTTRYIIVLHKQSVHVNA